MAEATPIRLIPNNATPRPELFVDRGGPIVEWAERAGIDQTIIGLSAEPVLLLDGLRKVFDNRDEWEEVAFENQLEYSIPQPKRARPIPNPKLTRLLSPEFRVPELDEYPSQTSRLMAFWANKLPGTPYISHYKTVTGLKKFSVHIGQEISWSSGRPNSLSLTLRLPNPPGLREITTRKTDETYRLNAIKTIMYACQLLVPADVLLADD